MSGTQTRNGAVVIDCQAFGCSFNHNRTCRTIGINIGGPEPLCDTFIDASTQGGTIDTLAMVGACKVQSCAFNKVLECTTKNINVVLRNDQAWCGSYQARA